MSAFYMPFSPPLSGSPRELFDFSFRLGGSGGCGFDGLVWHRVRGVLGLHGSFWGGVGVVCCGVLFVGPGGLIQVV